MSSALAVLYWAIEIFRGRPLLGGHDIPGNGTTPRCRVTDIIMKSWCLSIHNQHRSIKYIMVYVCIWIYPCNIVNKTSDHLILNCIYDYCTTAIALFIALTKMWYILHMKLSCVVWSTVVAIKFTEHHRDYITFESWGMNKNNFECLSNLHCYRILLL